MARFSERYGYTPIRDVMQLESMDESLRNGLWSAFYDIIARNGGRSGGSINKSSEYFHLLIALWKRFYKLPTDTLPIRFGGYDESLKFLRDSFYRMEWVEVYDFTEFIYQNIFFDLSLKPKFAKTCNEVLRTHLKNE